MRTRLRTWHPQPEDQPSNNLNELTIKRGLKDKEAERTHIDQVIGHSGLEEDFQHSLNLITDINPATSSEVHAIGEFLWVQVPCAVGSGAGAHVTHANPFVVLGPEARSAFRDMMQQTDQISTTWVSA